MLTSPYEYAVLYHKFGATFPNSPMFIYLQPNPCSVSEGGFFPRHSGLSGHITQNWGVAANLRRMLQLTLDSHSALVGACDRAGCWQWTLTLVPRRQELRC